MGLVDHIKGAFERTPEPDGDDLDDGYMMGDICEDGLEDE